MVSGKFHAALPSGFILGYCYGNVCVGYCKIKFVANANKTLIDF